MMKLCVAVVAALFALAPASAATIVRNVTITPRDNSANAQIFGDATFDPFTYAAGDTVEISLTFSTPVALNFTRPLHPILSLELITDTGGVRSVAPGTAITTFSLVNPVGAIRASGGVPQPPQYLPSVFGATYLDTDSGATTGVVGFDGFTVTHQIQIGGNGALVNSAHFSLSGWEFVPVPEPATWAMLIAGFGLAGGALRQRRANARHGVAEVVRLA